MLIVMHDWNVQLFHKSPLDLKTFWGFDIFKIDSSEGGSNGLDSIDESINIDLIHLNVEDIDVSECLEQ